MQVSRHLTLRKVEAGFFSVTKTFRLEGLQPDDKLSEANIHAAVCAADHKIIQKGVTYKIEYRNTSGATLGRFQVDACP
jgi:hypothetical protein